MLSKYLETMQAGLGIAPLDNDLGVALRSELQDEVIREWDGESSVARSILEYQMENGDYRSISLDLDGMMFEGGQGEIDEATRTYMYSDQVDDEIISVKHHINTYRQRSITNNLEVIESIINQESEWDDYDDTLERVYEDRLEGLLVEVSNPVLDSLFGEDEGDQIIILGSPKAERRLSAGYDTFNLIFVEDEIINILGERFTVEDVANYLAEEGSLTWMGETSVQLVDLFYVSYSETYQYERSYSDDYPYGGDWDITFEVDGHMQLGGRREAQTVFAFISQEVKFWIETLEPDKITFSGDTNRVSLYSRLVKMIANSGYEDFSIVRDGTTNQNYTIQNYPRNSPLLALQAELKRK